MKSASRPVPHIDFETDQTHDITVETTDSGRQYLFSEVVTLTVNDLIDENPDGYHADWRFR